MSLITYKKRFIYTVQGDPRLVAVKLREHLANGLEHKGTRKIAVGDASIRFAEGMGRFRLPLLDGEIILRCRNDRLGVAYKISLVKVYLTDFLSVALMGILLFGLGASGALRNTLLVFFIQICFIEIATAFGTWVSLSLFDQFMEDSLREFFNSVSSLGVQDKLITSR